MVGGLYPSVWSDCGRSAGQFQAIPQRLCFPAENAVWSCHIEVNAWHVHHDVWKKIDVQRSRSSVPSCDCKKSVNSVDSKLKASVNGRGERVSGFLEGSADNETRCPRCRKSTIARSRRAAGCAMSVAPVLMSSTTRIRSSMRVYIAPADGLDALWMRCIPSTAFNVGVTRGIHYTATSRRKPCR